MITIDNNNIVKGYFPNGEVELHSDKIIEWLDCALVPAVKVVYEDDKDMFHLLLLAEFLTEKGRIEDTILEMDFMPYSQMDREIPGKMFTLKYVCNLINKYDWEKIRVRDPHSNVTPALLNRCSVFYGCGALALWDTVFASKNSFRYDYVLFPDTGASKKYIEAVESLIYNDSANENEKPNWPIIITGHKKRNLDTGEIVEYVLDCNDDLTGKKVMICDDLVMGGRTFVEAATRLRNLGASRIDLYVTHLMPQAEKFFRSNGKHTISNIYSDDTLGMAAKWDVDIFDNHVCALCAEDMDIADDTEDKFQGSIIECEGDMFTIDNYTFANKNTAIVFTDPVNMWGTEDVNGLAKQFKQSWPATWDKYKSWVADVNRKLNVTKQDERYKLGVHLEVIDHSNYESVLYVNTMPWWGVEGNAMRAVEKGLEAIADPSVLDTNIVYNNKGTSRVLVLPALGCGIGGLDYNDVRPLLIKCANKLIDDKRFEKVIIMTPDYEPNSIEVVRTIRK